MISQQGSDRVIGNAKKPALNHDADECVAWAVSALSVTIVLSLSLCTINCFVLTGFVVMVILQISLQFLLNECKMTMFITILLYDNFYGKGK